MPLFITSDFPPRLVSWLSIILLAPWVIDTREITAATPIIIPRIVKNDLILLLFIALYEIVNDNNGFICNDFN